MARAQTAIKIPKVTIPVINPAVFDLVNKLDPNTKYHPKYCRELIAFFLQPLYSSDKEIQYPSFLQFAFHIGVSEKTLYNWREVYPEFETAWQFAKRVQEEHVVKRALTRKYDTTFSIFYLKNKYGWVDRQDVNLKSENLNLTFHVSRDGDSLPPPTNPKSIKSDSYPQTSDNNQLCKLSGQQESGRKALPEPTESTPPRGAQEAEQVPAIVDGQPHVHDVPSHSRVVVEGEGVTRGGGQGAPLVTEGGTPTKSTKAKPVKRVRSRKKSPLTAEEKAEKRRAYMRNYMARKRAGLPAGMRT